MGRAALPQYFQMLRHGLPPMAAELFIARTFQTTSRILIRQANEIIAEYEAQGFVLTLRQLYYQFVQRNIIPNKLAEYKRLGSVLNDARLAGKVDWLMIEDRTRNLEELPKWRSTSALISTAAEQFRTDIWASQPYRIEVWIEKEALTGVIERVCDEFRVPYFACRGYTSQSEQWRAGHRMRRYVHNRQQVLILHLGDHDPSGIDMTRDNVERLQMFMRRDAIDLELRRIALNMDQIEELNLPPNPAKATDIRFNGYVDKYGTDESWELDALEPSYIEQLIRDNIEPLVDQSEWDAVAEAEDEARRVMKIVAARYTDVSYLAERPDYE